MSTINSASGDLTLNATGSGNDLNLQANGSTKLTLKADGRGLSQFTAKAWVNFNGTGTVAIRDSHNVSSITDNSTGHYTMNFSNSIANSNYSATGSAGSPGNRYGRILIPAATKSASSLSCRTEPSHQIDVGFDHTQISMIVFGD